MTMNWELATQVAKDRRNRVENTGKWLDSPQLKKYAQAKDQKRYRDMAEKHRNEQHAAFTARKRGEAPPAAEPVVGKQTHNPGAALSVDHPAYTSGAVDLSKYDTPLPRDQRSQPKPPAPPGRLGGTTVAHINGMRISTAPAENMPGTNLPAIPTPTPLPKSPNTNRPNWGSSYGQVNHHEQLLSSQWSSPKSPIPSADGVTARIPREQRLARFATPPRSKYAPENGPRVSFNPRSDAPAPYTTPSRPPMVQLSPDHTHGTTRTPAPKQASAPATQPSGPPPTSPLPQVPPGEKPSRWHSNERGSVILLPEDDDPTEAPAHFYTSSLTANDDRKIGRYKQLQSIDKSARTDAHTQEMADISLHFWHRRNEFDASRAAWKAHQPFNQAAQTHLPKKPPGA